MKPRARIAQNAGLCIDDVPSLSTRGRATRTLHSSVFGPLESRRSPPTTVSSPVSRACILEVLAVLPILAVSGCAGPIPVSVVSTRDIGRPTDDPTAETRTLLDDAFGVWGLSWTTSTTIDGALELTLTGFDEDAQVQGFNVRAGDCDKSIVVEPDALVLAHEVGHVFGLHDHEEEPGFVMSDPWIDWSVTDDQVDTVTEDADRFSRCR